MRLRDGPARRERDMSKAVNLRAPHESILERAPVLSGIGARAARRAASKTLTKPEIYPGIAVTAQIAPIA